MEVSAYPQQYLNQGQALVGASVKLCCQSLALHPERTITGIRLGAETGVIGTGRRTPSIGLIGMVPV
jgi:hypothetical protein